MAPEAAQEAPRVHDPRTCDITVWLMVEGLHGLPSDADVEADFEDLRRRTRRLLDRWAVDPQALAQSMSEVIAGVGSAGGESAATLAGGGGERDGQEDGWLSQLVFKPRSRGRDGPDTGNAERVPAEEKPGGGEITMPKKSAKGGGTRSRSAITGRYVKTSTAKKNPRTTVNESTKQRKR